MSLGNMLVGEQGNQEGEGAGKIVGVNAHKFATHRACPGVEEATALKNLFAEILEEVDILTVQVEDENRAVSERPYLHRDIDHPHDQCRNDKSSE